jgi:hypothetical protein
MDTNELIKLLDERDAAARRAEKKAKLKVKVQAKAKDDGKKKKAKKAAKAAKSPDVSKLTKTIASVAKTLGTVQGEVQKIAAQPAPGMMLNASGLAGKTGAAAFKALEDQIAQAVTPQEAAALRQQLAKAKMIANERARVERPQLAVSQFGPNATPILTNEHGLPDDPSIMGVGRSR